MEIYKDIPGYEGYYQVSNLGNVKSIRSNKVIKPTPHTKGYLKAQLCVNGKRKMLYIHRLVAELFIPNELGLEQVNHINRDKHDNRVENLEWVSCQDNIIHFYQTGGHKK